MPTNEKSETKKDATTKDKMVDKKDIEKDKAIENIMDDKSDTPMDKSKMDKKKDNNTPKVIAGIIVGFLILFILLIVVTGVGMYKFNWSNQLTKLLPFPAAMVDGAYIGFSDYQDDIETLDFFYAAQTDTLGTVPNEEYIQKTVISRMIREKFLEKYAKDNSIEVTEAEVDAEYQVLVDQAGTAAEVDSQLLTLYNWTSDQFKEKVLKPFIIRAKVQEKVVGEDSESKATAEDVLAKIKNEEMTFEDAAKEYSEDITAAEGGELGYFGRGQMVPEFESAAFALEVDEISEVVQTDYGFHIIKVLEKVDASEDTGEQLNAAHILIKTVDIDEWTNEQLADSSIRLFVNNLEWKDDCGLALLKTETCENNNLIDYLNTASTVPTE